jgi:hypothetical protein
MKWMISAVAVFVVAAGCAKPAAERAAGTNHPANPGAAEGVVPDAERTLSTGDVRLPAEQERAARAGTGSAAASKPTTTPPTTNVAMYMCPMHKEFVTADPAARCPKCGMKLVPRVAAGATKPSGELMREHDHGAGQ